MITTPQICEWLFACGKRLSGIGHSALSTSQSAWPLFRCIQCIAWMQSTFSIRALRSWPKWSGFHDGLERQRSGGAHPALCAVCDQETGRNLSQTRQTAPRLRHPGGQSKFSERTLKACHIITVSFRTQHIPLTHRFAVPPLPARGERVARVARRVRGTGWKMKQLSPNEP